MFIFFTILVIICVFLCLVLALFFLLTPRGSVPENRTMTALLVVFGLQIIYSFMTSNYAYEYFLEWHKPIFLIRLTSLLSGPLLYFYVMAILKKKVLSLNGYLYHFLPFVLSLILVSGYIRDLNQFVIWQSMVNLIITIIILGSHLFYIILSIVSMRSSKTGLMDIFRNMRSAPQTTWLQVLLLGFIILWIVNLNSFAVYMIVQKPGWCAYTASIFALMLFLFLTLLMFMVMMKPDIYYVITKYRNNNLQEQARVDHLRKLNSYMEVQKPYLNPDISLESLAAELGMNTRVLSQVINESTGKSFKQYILDYRIRESMKILAYDKEKKLTILEVLYQVGFNSKSAFNYQFKIFTSLTPQEYRAKCME
jgi:AraC-like DNA-binding protein